MKKTLLVIPILALLLLAAHALRQGDYGLTAAFALMAGMFFTREGWVRIAAIVALAWGAYIWSDTTVDFIRIRQALGMPWARLGYIMAGVTLFNLIGMLTLFSGMSRGFFHKNSEQASARAAMFVLVSFGLAIARSKVPFPILLGDRYFPGWGWLEVFILGFYASYVGGLMLTPKGHRTYRPRIWAIFTVVFFLQLILGLVGFENMLQTGKLHLPVPAMIAAGPVFRGGGFFMLILFSVTLLLVGPAWCSHLCYIGSWDDVMSRFGSRPAPNRKIGKLAVVGRSGTLCLTVGAAFVLNMFGVPGMIAVGLAAVFGLIGVGVMVFVSRKTGMMAHCTTYCPMGLIANVFGKISPWRIRVGKDCTKCGACFTRCRYNALDEKRVELGSPGLSCTMCGDCLSVCAGRQIEYRFPGLSAEVSRTMFIVLVVSLHAIFLGVARI